MAAITEKDRSLVSTEHWLSRLHLNRALAFTSSFVSLFWWCCWSLWCRTKIPLIRWLILSLKYLSYKCSGNNSGKHRAPVTQRISIKPPKWLILSLTMVGVVMTTVHVFWNHLWNRLLISCVLVAYLTTAWLMFEAWMRRSFIANP